MDSKQKYSRNEISKILKIASELERSDQQEEEGLTREELERLAEEVGIDPRNIESAIYQLQEKNFDFPSQSFYSENFKFREIRVLDVVIDDKRWEQMVEEIRSITGDLGKAGQLGNTYEWEQRKPTMGYIQTSISPGEESSRLQISANYKNYYNRIGFLGGITGFVFLSVATSFIPIFEGFEVFGAAAGAILGWGAARLYLKSWMAKKRVMLRSVVERLSGLFGGEDQVQDPGISEGRIEMDEQAEYEDDGQRAQKGKRTKTK